MTKALVVFSGGQDSTTCLYWAIKEFGISNIEAITFDYQQRHRIELECAEKITDLVKVPQTVLPINTFQDLGGSALTEEAIEVKSDLNPENQLPNTFVPGRNLIFLTFAAAHAYKRGIKTLVMGVSQTDYSGYPDCRRDTIDKLELAINAGMEYDVTILTPLIEKSKKETVELAIKVEAMEAMSLTHTCYNGEQPPCGACPACELRAKGFSEAGVIDPLVERFQ
jgi:7-cyano-7-deazaguanine synthase